MFVSKVNAVKHRARFQDRGGPQWVHWVCEATSASLFSHLQTCGVANSALLDAFDSGHRVLRDIDERR